MKEGFKPGVMRVCSGEDINLLDPKPEVVDLQDIAHALGHTCRFGGHTRIFYSVAQHSVNVMKLIMQGTAGSRDLLKMALLHDAAEAYLGDMIRPVKVLMGMEKFRETEKAWERVIFAKYGVNSGDDDMRKVVHNAEMVVHAWEIDFLINGDSFGPRVAKEAGDHWYEVYHHYKAWAKTHLFDLQGNWAGIFMNEAWELGIG